MTDFWDAYEREARPPTAKAVRREENARPSSQNDTTGVCEFCGFVDDDVLLGVCADCAKE